MLCRQAVGIILFECFRLSLQEDGADSSHKDFSERATISAIVGSKGDEFGGRTCKRVFNGTRHWRHGIQNRITNFISKMVVLFAI